MKVLWLTGAGLLLFLAPPLRADSPKKLDARTFQVPYRMTAAQHVMVRARINGKGPFNFIIDTGAPALFVATAVGQKLGVEADKRGWGTFDRFEIEGGVVLTRATGRLETPFQLEGMNGMGLAGAELHGVIGYNILARYRITYDFTRDKMIWTELDFEPPPPQGLEGKSPAGGMDAMAGVMKLMGALLGKRPQPEFAPRGCLGVELSDGDGGVTIQSVAGPAAAAGLKPGDRITQFNGKAVKSSDDVRTAAAKVTSGAAVKLTISRGGASQEITVKAGEGL
jgi:hypothetical protein